MNTEYKKLVLHVGTEKTGTTSIQHMLWRNKENLLKSGAAYLECLGAGPNIKLTAACIEYDELSPVLKSVGIGSEKEHVEFKENLKAEICKEVECKQPNSIVISDEHINIHLKSIAELKMLMEYFPDYNVSKIIIFLRRQDRFIESLVSESVKNLSLSDSAFDLDTLLEDIIPSNETLPCRLEYSGIISKFVKAFPDAEIVVEGYEEKESGYNSVERFFEIVDLPVKFNPIEEGVRENGSIPFITLDSLIRIASKLKTSKDENAKKRWREFIKVVSVKFDGSSTILNADQRISILRAVTQSNKTLYKLYPSLERTLSMTDYSQLREVELPPRLSVERLLDLVADTGAKEIADVYRSLLNIGVDVDTSKDEVSNRGAVGKSKDKSPRVVFVHIPKCGGSSIRDAVFRSAITHGYEKSEMLVPGKIQPITHDKLYNDVGQTQKYRIVASHIFPQGIRPDDLSFTFLRDPIERFVSHYYFFCYKKKGSSYFSEKKLSKMSTAEISDLSNLGNIQTKWLCGSIGNNTASYSSEMAIDTLERFTCYGLLSDMSCSVENINQSFQNRFNLEFPSVINKRKKEYSEEFSDVLDYLREINSMDMLLYNHALKNTKIETKVVANAV